MLPKIKILLISYYWPPAGGGGVQRWLKMSKFIADNNVNLTVYTPNISNSTLLDKSLNEEIDKRIKVIHTNIWEPYDIYKIFTNKKKNESVYSGFINESKKPSLTQKISVFIRGNFFIPDARMFWIKPSIAFLKNYLKNNPTDVIISTGPPHSMHMIAEGIKSFDSKIKWIADFRDPWTKIDFYDKLKLTKWGDNKHKKLEKNILSKADKIVTVSNSWLKDFEKLSNRTDIQLITNGYDHLDFINNRVDLDSSFSIAHIGSMNADRNPETLWSVLAELCESDIDFKNCLKIKLIGQVDFAITSSIQKYNLNDNCEKINFLPHKKVIDKMLSSQILLLPINRTSNSMGILPGKLYEYMGAKRPILCIGPKEADSHQIISNTNAGYCVDYDDFTNTKKYILEMYIKYKEGNLSIESHDIEKYSRKSLADKYIELIYKVLDEN